MKREQIRKNNKQKIEYVENTYGKDISLVIQLLYWFYLYQDLYIYSDELLKTEIIKLVYENFSEYIKIDLFVKCDEPIVNLCDKHLKEFKKKFNKKITYRNKKQYKFYKDNCEDKCDKCKCHYKFGGKFKFNITFGDVNFLLSLPYENARTFLPKYYFTKNFQIIAKLQDCKDLEETMHDLDLQCDVDNIVDFINDNFDDVLSKFYKRFKKD